MARVRKQLNSAKSQGDARKAANECQEHALSERLADQPAATGTQREAHGHFALPCGSPREQEVGHIDAGDQQDESNRRRQNEQRPA